MSELLYLPAHKTVRIIPDLSLRPTRIELPRNKRSATLVLALVSIWGAVGTVVLFHGLARLWTTNQYALWSSLGPAFTATIIAIFFGVLAMRLYVSNDTIHLFDDHVELTTYTLLHKRNWSARYDTFKGLQSRQVIAGEGALQKNYQLVELVHANAGHTLPLYLEKRSHPPSTLLEELTNQLGLPLLGDNIADLHED